MQLAANLEFAVVDVETTGFSPRSDRVLEVAIVRVRRDGSVVDRYVTLVNPGRDVGPTEVHGISATDVADAPSFAEVLGDVVSLLSDAIVVGHNARFDLSFLRAEAARAMYETPAAATLCTLDLSHRLGLELPRRRLRLCCEDAGIELVEAHSALGDASATARLLVHYLDLAERSGLLTHAALGLEDPLVLTWPTRPRTGRALPREQARRDRDDGAMMRRLLARLESPRDLSAALAAYCDVLERALEDRQLTMAETDALFEVARLWDLRADDLRLAHNAYLKAIAEAALGDGHISAAEHDDLVRIAQLLGIEAPHFGRICDEAKTARATLVEEAVGIRTITRSPLAGRTICFTGSLGATIRGERITRLAAEALAREAGLEVRDRVTRDLEILVVSDPATQSTKAKKAREYGTRILAEMELWKRLGVVTG